MWNKKYAPALAILLAAGLTAGSLPVDVAAANAEQTEDVGAQEEKAKSTIEEGAGATGDSSKDKEESKSTDGGDTKTAETSKEDGKGSDKDAGTNQGDNSDAGTGTGKTESKETGTGDAGTGEAGAGESDENGSDNTTIVPPQEDGGEAEVVDEAEKETWTVSFDKNADDVMSEGDEVTVTITLNQTVRYCQTFQYRLYVDPTEFEYLDDSLNCDDFGRSIVITDLQTDENDSSKKYYAFSPDELGGILDSQEGSSFTVTFRALKNNLNNISQYFSGQQYESFQQGRPYKVTLNADYKKAVGDEVQVKTKIGQVSNSSGRKQYSAYSIKLAYDQEKLLPMLDSLDKSCVVDNTESGKLTISWSGELKKIGEVFNLKFKARKDGIASVQLLSARVDDQDKLEDGTYVGIDPGAPDAEIPENGTNIKIGYHVNLPENYSGSSITNPGEDYTFTEPSDLDKEHYTYTVTAKVREAEVSVTDNKNGSYTISKDAIKGDLVITSTATPVQYGVTVNGGGKDDVNAGEKATYSEDYTFKVKEDSDYTYTVTAKVEDKVVTLSKSEKEENGTVTYTIAAGEVTGNIKINVDKQVKTTAITFDGTGKEDVLGLDVENETTKYIKTVPNNADFVFSVDEKEGYLYTVKIGEEELTKGEDGKYKISEDRLTGTPITVTVEKAEQVDLDIAVDSYMEINGKKIFRLTVKSSNNLPEGKVLAYETTPMYWSEQYKAYTWLLCSDKSKDEIKKEAEDKITQMDVADIRPVIAYDGDVNGTTLTDVNDAQFVYGIYNKDFEMDITKQDDMQKLLRADMNGDGVIDIKDAAAVIDKVMHPETADKK